MVVLMESEPLDLSPNGPSVKNLRGTHSVLTSRLNLGAGLVLKGLRSTVLWCLGVARARRA